MVMNLIFDIDSNVQYKVEEYINESTGKTDKKYKIKGIFSTIGEKNRNGRIYPRELWETEISKYQENLREGNINTLMEWEHPARTSVDMMEAVAKIEKLHIDGKYVMGEAVLLDNTKANQIKSLIDNGIKISVSSRGVGSVKDGVVNNFKLVTYDLVNFNSDYNATMNGLVESYQLNEGIIESLDFYIDESGNIKQFVLSESIDTEKSTFSKEEIDQAIVQRFSNIIEKLKNL